MSSHKSELERSGFWAQAMYSFYDLTDINIQPIIKYESYEADWSGDEVESIITFGVNYFFNDWTRLQLNYLYKSEQPEEIKNDEILMQLQVKF